MDRAASRGLCFSRAHGVGLGETHLVLTVGFISPGQDLVHCQQSLLSQGSGWGGAAHAGAKVFLPKHKDAVQRGRVWGKDSCMHVSALRSLKLDPLDHCLFPSSRWDHEDLEERFCRENRRYAHNRAVDFRKKDDTLQVRDLKPGWKEFVQHRALGR